MDKVAGLVSVALVVLAIALHLFYIDYEVDGRGYIVSWPATTSQRQELASRLAYTRVVPSRRTVVERPSLTERIRTTREFQQQNCTFKDGQPVGWDIQFFQDLVCEREYTAPQVTRETMTIPGVTYRQALRGVQVEIARREVLFGARPSEAFAGTRPSRSSIQKAFWLGLILPFASVIGAACMLVMAGRSQSGAAMRRATSPGRQESESETPNRSEHGPETLAQMLRGDLGPDFPVESGNAKKHDPLVVTARADYVSVEYAVVRHVLRAVREEFKLSTQTLMDEGGRKIDELVFDVKPVGATEWAGQRRFYFDITAGYGHGHPAGVP